MSWEIFKNNILAIANNPDQISSIEQVAELYAKEYDNAMKRGRDATHGIAISVGNVELMKQLFISALQKGNTQSQPYDLVGEMGKGVIAYWQGATMNNFPIPILPAPGSVVNVAVISNTISNPGVWQPPIPSQPNFKMSQEQVEGAKEDLASAQSDLKKFEEDGNEEAAQTAREAISLQENRIAEEEDYSVAEDEPILSSRSEIPLEGGGANPIGTPDTINETTQNIQSEIPADLEIGKKIVAYALRDIGTLENPLPPGKPENWGTRVSEMLKGVGFNTPAYWCAAAVSSWYKSAGAKSPNSASCDVWMVWAKKNGLFSSEPAIGAAVLYGSSADAHHIGIVESIQGDRVKTIEGNTSGGGFNRNGVGVFRKSANIKKVVGFVLPVKK